MMKALDPVVLEVSNLRYHVGDRELFRSLDLVVQSGQSVAISGPSGCGKSTLLMCCLGMVKPDAGEVVVCGERMDRLSGRRLLRHRQESVGMVFQAGELLPELAPLENVAIAGLLARVPRTEAFTRAEELLAELAVPVDATDTGSLSGGERQRVAVARALVNRPALLLADEPTGALDSAARETVADLLYALPERWQCGLVVVTHDPAVAARAERRYLLTDAGLIPAGISESAAATGAAL